MLTLRIKAVPNASRDQIAGVMDHPDGPRLKVRVSAPPEAGKANKAIAKLLAKELGCKPSDVAITAGTSGTEKTVTFAEGSVTQAQIDALLNAHDH